MGTGNHNDSRRTFCRSFWTQILPMGHCRHCILYLFTHMFDLLWNYRTNGEAIMDHSISNFLIVNGGSFRLVRHKDSMGGYWTTRCYWRTLCWWDFIRIFHFWTWLALAMGYDTILRFLCDCRWRSLILFFKISSACCDFINWILFIYERLFLHIWRVP